MTAPRITKCGHIYCWPCLLQYIDYGKAQVSCKKCPLCSESVYKNELRKVTISEPLANSEVKPDPEEEQKAEEVNDNDIEFVLMVRNKSNIMVKF